MSAWRFQPRARLTYGASEEASRWLLTGTTSTRARCASTFLSWSTSGPSSRFQAVSGVVCTTSQVGLAICQPTVTISASTIASPLRDRQARQPVPTTWGTAASSATAPNSSPSRSTLEPTCEGIAQVSTMPTA